MIKRLRGNDPPILRWILGGAAEKRANRLLELAALEDRIILSATPVAVAAAPDAPSEDVGLLTPSGESALSAAQISESDLLDLLADNVLPPEDGAREVTELLFIDSSAEDYERFLEDIENANSPREFDIVVLDSTRNGIAQITEALADYQDLEAIHIVSHGANGRVQLGSTLLDHQNVDHYEAAFHGWQNALTTDADVLFYGCNLASDAEGQALTASLSDLIGADVAASVDLTGHTELGGNWTLEYTVGLIETETAFTEALQTTWYSTLDISTGLVGHYEFNSGGPTTDSSGNQDGTVSIGNATGETPSAVGDQAVGFAVDASGNNSYLAVADNAAQDFGTGDFTVSLWYNQNGTPAGTGRLIGDFGGSGNGFVIYAQANGAIDVELHDGTTITESIQGIFDGTWNQLTVVRTGSTLDIYHNGVNVSSSTGAGGNINSSNALWMGSSGTLGGDYDGQLDDVRLFTRALSSTDVDELVALGPAVATPPGPPTGYSNPSGGDNSLDYITNVTFAGINNTSGQDAAGYGNYTSEVGTVTLGDNNTLSVSIVEDNNNYVTAWVDWNQDGDFGDAGEEFVVIFTTSSPGPHTVNIATPGTATLGTTVMRIGTTWGQAPTADGGAQYREFEDYTINVTGGTPQTYTVTNTNDSGAGSLRQAIIDANANSGADTIEFSISGSVVHTITLASALPDIIDEVIIDGTTQAGYAGVPRIEVDASGAAGATAVLNLRASNSTIQGLSVYGSVDEGIEIDGSTGYGDNNTIIGNWVGVTADGTVVGNAGDGILISVDAVGNQIGGTGANEGNVVSGSGNAGINVRLGSTTDNSIRGNSVYGNDGIGVDLGDDGVTANDAGDADSGPNNLQNWAVLTSASINDAGNFSYNLDLSTLDGGSHTVDFYASTNRDGGQVEGKRYLFSANVSGSTTWSGSWGGITLDPGEYITTITTDSSGNSSEFSNYAVATDSDTNSTPSGIQAIATTEGGLSINEGGGNDVYLKADDGIGTNDLDALTYEIQFNSSDTSSRLSFLSYFNGGQDALLLTTVSGGDLRIAINNNVITSDAMDYESLRDGDDHTLSFTWDTSGTWAVYVDGEWVDDHVDHGALLASGHTVSAGGTLIIGHEQDADEGGFALPQRLSATVYDARLFSDDRSASEIASNYRSTLPFSEDNLVANWTFDRVSTDGVVLDAVGGNNLTVKHVTEPGFTSGTHELTFSIDENAASGSEVGTVYGVDVEREALIASLLVGDADLRYSSETGKFYKVIGGTQLWSAARTAAEGTPLNTVNGQLATIRSAY